MRLTTVWLMPPTVPMRELRRPPDRRPDVEDERGHEDRPHDERAERAAKREDEPDLGKERQRQPAEDREGARQHDARGRDDTAGHRQPTQHPVARAALERLL